MEIEFDTNKDILNQATHGVSLDSFSSIDLENSLVSEDVRREYGETRYNCLGLIGERVYHATFTIRNESVFRVTSLRKANKREVKRYAKQ